MPDIYVVKLGVINSGSYVAGGLNREKSIDKFARTLFIQNPVFFNFMAVPGEPGKANLVEGFDPVFLYEFLIPFDSTWGLRALDIKNGSMDRSMLEKYENVRTMVRAQASGIHLAK